MAASLAIAVKKETGIDTVLTGSTMSGAFEVRLDGGLIHSKLQTNRFPDHSEMTEVIKRKVRRQG